MINVSLLRDLCKLPGAPGFEQTIRERILREVTPLVDEVKVDTLGNVMAIKKGKSDKKVMIAAHMDEISLVVTHIDEKGFIRFHALGGFDSKTLTSQRVVVHGKEDILGVLGSKPIHVLNVEEKSKPPKITDFFIDTGLPVEKVKALVTVGDPITRERELVEMGDCVNAKSIDNRVSVFVLIEALRALKHEKLPMDVYGVFTVQEEVGVRGALMASSGENPDFGIALDTTLAYDLPGAANHEKITSLGHGVAIKVLDGMVISDYRMVRFMKQMAHKHDIKYQMEVLPTGATDTAGLQRGAKGGSISGALSIPTRYLHQVIEMAHKKDIANTIELLKACLREIDQYDWSFR